jgi:hypothetical protein
MNVQKCDEKFIEFLQGLFHRVKTERKYLLFKFNPLVAVGSSTRGYSDLIFTAKCQITFITIFDKKSFSIG